MENGNVSSTAPVASVNVPSVAIVTSNFFTNWKFVSMLPLVSLRRLVLLAGSLNMDLLKSISDRLAELDTVSAKPLA